MSFKNNEILAKEYPVNGKIITFTQPQIMAIVNITPDSFYDGGKYGSSRDVLCDVEEKIKNGASIIDIGAASSRPGADELTDDEEWSRLKIIFPEIRKQFPEILISIDTYRAKIALQAAAEGADMVNDIGGGDLDGDMFNAVVKMQLPYILMHIQGKPQTMQKNPTYQNVLKEVSDHFSSKIKSLRSLGFDKIILDPGFGFGKNLEHNYELLKGISDLKKLGLPLLAGISRKGMINKVIGTNPVTALNGTTTLNTIALLNGANILRVHDVQEAKQTIQLVEYYKNTNFNQ